MDRQLLPIFRPSRLTSGGNSTLAEALVTFRLLDDPDDGLGSSVLRFKGSKVVKGLTLEMYRV